MKYVSVNAHLHVVILYGKCWDLPSPCKFSLVCKMSEYSTTIHYNTKIILHRKSTEATLMIQSSGCHTDVNTQGFP